MSKITELQIELKELKDFVFKRIMEINEKYSERPDAIMVFVVPQEINNLMFSVNLENLKSLD